MSQKMNIYLLLLILFKLTTSAMVLPRPPSSPNHIHQDQNLARKIPEEKSFHSLSQDTNVKRPDIADYRLLEIELQSADEIEAANLQSLVNTMLNQEPNDSHLNPEVIPHSIVGVQDMGLRPNYRLDSFNDDKRALLSPPKLQNFNEKLYYLKNGRRPKVYVNIRGRSGSFRKETALSVATTNENPVAFLKVTRPFEEQTNWKSRNKKTRPPKKFDRSIDSLVLRNEEADRWTRLNNQKVSYRTNEVSTTENSMVTSSELPKQIPAPPSRIRGRTFMAQTTPVQRYALRRTDILPGYGFIEE